MKIYDRSNKHFYRQIINAGDQATNGNAGVAVDEDEDSVGMVASYLKRAEESHSQSGKLTGLVPKKGIRKKQNLKLVKPLPKMKIVVKSTKTISFDEHSDEDDSSDHNDESDGHEDTSSKPKKIKEDFGKTTAQTSCESTSNENRNQAATV